MYLSVESVHEAEMQKKNLLVRQSNVDAKHLESLNWVDRSVIGGFLIP